MPDRPSQVRSIRPAPDEHAPFYGGYIAKVADGDVVHQLEEQIVDTLGLLESLPEEKAGHRYAEGKWSIREVVGHLCDTERVFSYRAMRFARADATRLPGFDENHFVANGRFEGRSLQSLAEELETVRWATVAFFDALDDECWLRRGVANDKEMSVRALAWTAAGHELHHRQILLDRYL